MAKNNDQMRDELLDLVQQRPGEWFHVSYSLRCTEGGALEFCDLSAMPLNGIEVGGSDDK